MATLETAACAGEADEQWRIEPLNDGSVRLVARDSKRVLAVVNCGMAEGARLQQWVPINNPCQRFRIAAP